MAASRDPGQTWLMFIYRVPYDRQAPRVYVMRKLKELGAVYVQQAVAILPDRPELRTALQALARRVEGYPGEAALLVASAPDPTWEGRVVARFRERADEEYAELAGRMARFADEVGRGGGPAGGAIPAPDAAEQQWCRLADLLERIERRDFFGAPGQAAARAALARAETSLEVPRRRGRLLRMHRRLRELRATLGIADESSDVRGHTAEPPRRSRYMARSLFERLTAELRDIERAYAALQAASESPGDPDKRTAEP